MAALCLLVFYFILLLFAITSAVPREEFKCTSAGYFPDPEDCTHYHVCVHFPNAQPEFLDVLYETCEEGLAYDPRTTACSLDIEDVVCTRDSAECLYGDWGLVAEESTIYWTCENFKKVYYACAPGMQFSGLMCVEAPTTPTPGPAPGPPIGQKCQGAGAWCDPTTCYRYYTCSAKGKLRHHKCCSGFHYDQERHKCVWSSCNINWTCQWE